MSEKHLYLVDGHALAYRSYFAMIKSQLSNAKGQPTGATYAFAMYLLRLLELYKCPYLAVVFDSKKPTFRHEMYADYKAHREAMPDDLVSQMPLIHRTVEVLNIPVLVRDGYEADDVIACLTRKARDLGFLVSIITKDKDLMQLIDGSVRMLAPETGGKLEEYGPEQVKTKMGVTPGQIRDFLALTGDSSDNVPGVPGIGPKNALKILEKAGTVDRLLRDTAILENPTLQVKIEENRDKLLLSKKLVTLDRDFDVAVEIDSLSSRPVLREQAIEFFKDMDFRTLLKAPLFDVRDGLDFPVIIPTEIGQVRSFAARIREAGSVCIDTETTSLAPWEADLVGIALAIDSSEAMYIPVGHAQEDGQFRNLPRGDVLEAIRDIVESEKIRKIGQNLKYDYQIFKKQGLALRGISFDTMIAAYLLSPGQRQYNLDAIAAEWLSVRSTPIEDLIGKGKSQQTFDTVPIIPAAKYSAEDVILPLKLVPLLQPLLTERNLIRLFDEIEIPLVPVLAEMEWAGVLIDADLLGSLSVEFTSRLATVTAQIHGMAGEEFNLNSPKQIAEIFFNKLRMPKSKKTKTGLSTDVSALEKLAGEFPIAAKLLECREVQKLLGTYIDALPVQVSPTSGRLHSSFNQTVAATGRLSSTDPNLQNIPVRTEDGRRIREAFVAPSDHVLVSADYSQIELRILAHVSKDPLLTKAFIDDKDIHAETAAAVYGIFPELVTPDMRRAAKTINFGLMYGMGPLNLSRQLKISYADAQAFIDSYFRQFPTIKAYMSTVIEKARQCGYAETLLGRRRYLPDINSPSRQIREAAERTAINTPIQGTAADIIKIAMINIGREIGARFPGARMILQVHDELVFELPRSLGPEFRAWVIDRMSRAYSLDVPLKVDAGMGENWCRAH